jgi:hypothetical protein
MASIPVGAGGPNSGLSPLRIAFFAGAARVGRLRARRRCSAPARGGGDLGSGSYHAARERRGTERMIHAAKECPTDR